ncbi:two-component regulator propeller domain-containing protein [Fulvivirgaceae bacterium BMA12]|uniref:histidine kinase n=1 Tax=Agaribacillus aureus TaxID=3051825 RepID=A0ABT8LFA9_9BACT|nr:two-component regulator propeller domain-containing protein [Fulvivirgaceae bacterium BMA12]
MTKYLLALLFLSFINLAPAQSPELKFKHITVADGLSFNLVFEIIKDSHGFMWFGTTDGLNKYDGYEMTVYRHIHGDSTALPDNSVWALYEDTAGNLWVGTDGGGLSLYDRRLDRFINYQYSDSDTTSLSHNSVNVIMEDSNGKLWVGTYGGGINVMTAPGKFRRIKKDGPESLSNDAIHTIFKDRAGNMWVGTQEGLNCYDSQKQTFQTYLHDAGDITSISNNNVLAISEDAKGYIWLGTWGGGVNRLDRDTGQFDHYVFDFNKTRNRIAAIFTDSKEQLWVGLLGGGLAKYDHLNNNFSYFSHDPLNPGSIANNNIWIFYEDEQNYLWMGTENGISRIDLKNNPIQSFGGLNHHLSLGHSFVNNFDSDADGHLLVATEQSIEKIDHNTSQPSNFTDLALPGIPENIEIWSICIDRRKDLWISTYGNGLFRMRPDNRQPGGYRLKDHFQPTPDNPGTISSNFCSYVYEDNNGIIWAATYGQGLNRYDPGTNSFKKFLIDNPGDASPKSAAILNLYDGSNGYLWVGTYGRGLIKMNKENGDYTVFQKDPNNSNSLSHNTVLAVYKTSDSILWIGTDGGGLNKLHIGKEKFDMLTVRDGLPSDVIVGILEDKHGNLWVSTNGGISKFNPLHQNFKNYDQSNGLVSQSFNPDACFMDENGYFYFGSGNGYNRFHPDSLHINELAPPLFITDFKINNKTVPIAANGILTQHINLVDNIVLDHRQKLISFNFAALEFDNAHKNLYAYKLEGFNSDWVHTNAANRTATYTNLSADEYIFKVKSTNNDGVWNDHMTTIKLRVLPPPWKTWWAYTIYLMVILLIVLLIFRTLIMRERLKAKLQLERMELEKLQEVNQMKSRFFANVSHEFRTPLTLISGPVNDIIEKEDDDGKKAHLSIVKRNTERLKRLIDQILDLSKLEAGKLEINEKEVSLFKFLNALSSSFLSLAEKKEISYQVQIPASNTTVLMDDEKLEMIVYNLISNALKFTPSGGKVTINAETINKNNEDHLILTVSDTGPGLDEKERLAVFDRFYRIRDQAAANEGTGIGLALTKELVTLMRGQITIKGDKGKGAIFQVTLPIKIVEVSSIENNNDSDPPVAVEIQNPEAMQPASEGPKVLIVEDNEDLRQYIKSILKDEHHLMEAGDGETGLRIAKEEIPDLIISDLMMPKMEGDELCRQVKTDERTSHIPFIMVTAKAGRDDKLAGLEHGADDYLPKPFDRKELQLKVKNILLRRERLQEKMRRELMTQPSPGEASSQEDRFILRLREIVEHHLGDDTLNVNFLSREMGMSRVQLYRKLFAVTGLSASDFIRNMRIHKAAELLKSDWGRVSDVAYEVGFNNLSYFTKCFKAQYGQTPSEFLQSSS